MEGRAKELVEAAERLLRAARELDGATARGGTLTDIGPLRVQVEALSRATEAAVERRRPPDPDIPYGPAGAFRRALRAGLAPGLEPYPDMDRLAERIRSAGWEDAVVRDLMLGLGSHLSLHSQPQFLDEIDAALAEPAGPAPR